MNIRPIRNETDYRAALKAVERVMDGAPGTPAGVLLEALVDRIEAYEAAVFPMGPHDDGATQAS